MKSYGIVIVVTVIAATARPGAAQAPAAGTNHAAAVVSMRGRYVGSVDLSLPEGTTQADAEGVWERLKSATGWQFDGAEARTEKHGLSIHATVLGAQALDLSGMAPAWPFIQALSEYSTIALVFLGGPAPVRGSGDFINRYVSAEWTQSQGVRYYHVTIKDASFESIDDLRRRGTQQPAAADERSQTGRWVFVAILAAVAGIIAYGVARAVLTRRRQG